ncbi:hypothetical protein QBC46DRAFT_374137 [Diplogelasinospora grovesii]|uniref:intramembrane prenyl-peptidase Rce1 n=1 Tax=Diplogelasinospora grovesii TaxID=303347 RepID=A0AAN6NH34_9PEZI|nr:hypothetical protein QBC46DRAFT_374137 [Diplogelasinospora grovesii]
MIPSKMPVLRSLLDKIEDKIDKLNPWHKDEPPQQPPPITTRTAILLLSLYALIYFLPFYLSSQTRPSPTLTRDAPSAIRARVRSVTISCIICCTSTYLILSRTAHASIYDTLHFMGVYPPALLSSTSSLLLTALLFLGPLFEYFVVEAGWRDWTSSPSFGPLREVLSEWTSWRNIIAGPITEELLYRSASVPLMLLSQSPVKTTIFLSPVIFGLSHLHHFYEFRLTHPQVPLAAAILRSIFQFGYTTLFGSYATFIYIRTGSLLAVCLVHAFCNAMGLPRFYGRVEPYPVPAVDSAVTTGSAARPGGAGSRSRSRNRVLLWTIAYYTLLVIGAASWYKNLSRLTDSTNALVPNSAFSSSNAA